MKILLVLLLFITGISYSQIPDKFTNLQFFQKDISQKELMDNMVQFASSLGVRCHHCHVGEDEVDFSEWDFASDEKTAKLIAREMLLMVKNVNADLEMKMSPFSRDIVKVKCVTCHRANTKPLMIQDVLYELYDSEGLEAAVKKYKELREKYYGSYTFDFKERVLINFASKAANDGKPAEALTILKLNKEYDASSPDHFRVLGQVYALLGQIEEAKVAYKKVLELQPNNKFIKAKLEELESAN